MRVRRWRLRMHPHSVNILRGSICACVRELVCTCVWQFDICFWVLSEFFSGNWLLLLVSGFMKEITVHKIGEFMTHQMLSHSFCLTQWLVVYLKYNWISGVYMELSRTTSGVCRGQVCWSVMCEVMGWVRQQVIECFLQCNHCNAEVRV